MNRIVLQNSETGELGKSWQAVARSQRRTFMVKSRRVASCSAVPTFTCGAGTSRAADFLRKNAGNFERLTRLFSHNSVPRFKIVSNLPRFRQLFSNYTKQLFKNRFLSLNNNNQSFNKKRSSELGKDYKRVTPGKSRNSGMIS